jgi:hypothetical protein
MDVKRYCDTSEDMLLLAAADEMRQTRPILKALRKRQDLLLEQATKSPRSSDDLVEDIVGVLGEIRGIGFLFSLIEEAKTVKNREDD